MARIAVAATATFGADVLEGLAQKPRDLGPAHAPGRTPRPWTPGRPSPAKVVAERLGMPVLQPDRPEQGLGLGADVVVVCAYGLLIPEELLSQQRWLNVHPSLLPRWRGAAPVERAILAGDAETGVTIHETVKELDAGPILAQEPFVIGADDDAGIVFAHATTVAVRLLDSVLADSNPVALPQEVDGVTYADKVEAADRRLDLTLPAEELVRRVRALSPHIGARTVLHGRQVTVWRARVGETGAFEPVEVQPDGGRRMDAAAWLRGLR